MQPQPGKSWGQAGGESVGKQWCRGKTFRVRDLTPSNEQLKLFRIEDPTQNLLHLLMKDYLKYYEGVLGLAVGLGCEDE